MRKLIPLLVLSMPVGIAACNDPAGTTSIENNAEVMADALERRADDLEAMAGAAANDSAAAMFDSGADNLEDQADNVRDLAGEKAAQH